MEVQNIVAYCPSYYAISLADDNVRSAAMVCRIDNNIPSSMAWAYLGDGREEGEYDITSTLG